ncbi:hypothetical protein EMCRGX_G029387 [Ephydatia muelleri]
MSREVICWPSEKDAFQDRLDAAKRLLFPDGPLQRETCFLNALLDRVLTASPINANRRRGYTTSFRKFVARHIRSSHAERICSGTVANRNKSWFTELSDKMKSTKTHLYWCMENCTGNAHDLRVMIMNISWHYQGDH